MLLFVVSSMLAVGLSLTVSQIVAPLRNTRLVLLALVNFALIPLAGFTIAKVLRLDQPLRVTVLLLGAAAGAPFLPKVAAIAKGENFRIIIDLFGARGILESTLLVAVGLGLGWLLWALVFVRGEF